MNAETAENKAVRLIRRLIAARSYSGQEDAAAALISDTLKASGFPSVTTDSYGNVIGRIRGSRRGPTLLFDGHMDTVPVPEPALWHTSPFRPVIRDGKLYGRGTSDMKSAIGCFLVAAEDFLKKYGNDFEGTLAFSGIVMEECFEGIAARSVSRIVKPDLVMIGEASDCNIKVSQRGRAEIALEVFGRPAHTSNPEKGINAVYKMSEAVRRIRQLPAPVHPFMGEGILELTDILSSPYPGASVVPEYCRATFDRRLLVGETRESVMAPILSLLQEMSAEDPDFRAKASFTKGEEICRTGKKIRAERFFPGWMGDPKSENIRKIKKALEQTGAHPKITRYDFCTNGSHYAGEAGIETFGFGPSSEKLAHTVDEYVTLSQIRGAVTGYEAILEALLNPGRKKQEAGK